MDHTKFKTFLEALNVMKIRDISMLPLPLPFEEINNSAEVKESSHGKGVFALRDIEENKVVTIYPNHGIQLSNGYGTILSKLEIPSEEKFWEYALNMDDGSVLYGDPSRLDSGLLGHMLNDSANDVDKIKCYKPDELIRGCLNYEIKSKQNDNCMLLNKHGIGYVITTKKIKKGDELLASYGFEYWAKR